MALALGFRNNLFLLVPISVIAYFGSLDLSLASSHYVVLLFCCFIALLFDKPGSSPARRLIQVSTAICYGATVLQKLTFPGFINGDSLAAFAREEWVMRPFLLHFISRVNPPHEFFCALSLAVMLVEGFLCFALFFRKTRTLAIFTGILLHASMAIVMNVGSTIVVFSLTMMASYLAFLEPKERASQPPENHVHQDDLLVRNHRAQQVRRRLGTSLMALALLGLWLILPLRIYFWPGHPVSSLTLQDRRPWTFDMFVVDNSVRDVRVSYVDSSGTVHQVMPVGRMHYAQSDNELYALAQYVQHTHPDAERIAVEAVIGFNQRRWLQKTLRKEKKTYCLCSRWLR